MDGFGLKPAIRVLDVRESQRVEFFDQFKAEI